MKSTIAKLSHSVMTTIFTPIATTLLSQHDSLILKNGDVIVGEIKSLDKGVLTIKTGYSKTGFTIEWSGIKEIYSNTKVPCNIEERRTHKWPIPFSI